MDPSNPAVFWFFAIASGVLGVAMVGAVVVSVLTRARLREGDDTLQHRLDDLEMEVEVLKDRLDKALPAPDRPDDAG